MAEAKVLVLSDGYQNYIKSAQWLLRLLPRTHEFNVENYVVYRADCKSFAPSLTSRLRESVVNPEAQILTKRVYKRRPVSARRATGR